MRQPGHVCNQWLNLLYVRNHNVMRNCENCCWLACWDIFVLINFPFLFFRQTVSSYRVQYSPRNMHTVFALLCFVVVIHWMIFPYPSGLLHWLCGNLTIAPVPAKQPWWIRIDTSCEFIVQPSASTSLYGIQISVIIHQLHTHFPYRCYLLIMSVYTGKSQVCV